MKYLLTTVVMMTGAFAGHAQDAFLKLLKEKAIYPKVHIAPASVAPEISTDTATTPFIIVNGRQWSPEAVYSHKTSKGAIYLLSGDNMPCLVPDKRAVKNMPVIKPDAMQQYNMPNPYKPKVIIPDMGNRHSGSEQ